MRFEGFLIALVFFAGCQTEQKSLSGDASGEKPLSAHGTTDVSKPVAKANALKGTVLERLDSGRYSYLRLSAASKEIWAAVTLTDVKIGQEVFIEDPMPMDGYQSKTLNRRFDHIVFGTLRQESAPSADQQLTLQNAHAGVFESADATPVKVEKAAGPEGKTIAELFAQKLKLKGQEVVVRGNVVKVNANILGRTWLHLRDGTGDPAARTNDLTVTTKGSAAVGDTVMVKGTVHADKDLGMGYIFSIIIEDATVTKQ